MTTTESSTETIAPGTRLPALDGLRGVAVLLVLIYHFGGIPAIKTGSLTLFDEQWLKLAGVGWTGVDLFFVLSGFLITSILYDTKGPALTFFRGFYARRVLRIVPVYYAALIFLLFFLPLLVPAEEFFVNRLRENQIWLWLYLVNIELYVDPVSLWRTSHLIGHLWSLAIEEQFYLVWPLFVFLLGRRSLLAVTAGLIVAGAGIRVVLLATGDHPFQVFAFTPARMDALAVGACIALLVRGDGGRRFLSIVGWPLAWTALLGIVILFFVRDGLGAFDPWVQRVGLSLIALFFGGVVAGVALSSTESRVTRIFDQRVLAFFGKYSYALYVIHLPVANLLNKHTDFSNTIASATGFMLPGVLVFAALAGVISVALAMLSWRLLETPFLSLRHRFSQGPVRFAWGD